MDGLLSVKRATLVAATLVFAVLGLLPLFLMIASSLRVDDGFGGKNYVEVLGDPRIWILFRNSLLLAFSTTVVAGLAGVPLGILLARTDLLLSKSILVIFSLPLFFPPYILAVGWFEMLGRGGLLSRWVGPATVETTSRWLFGLPGAVLVLASALLPIVMLLTITSLRVMNPALEEAGRLSCNWPSVIRQITIPLVKPGILMSLVLVFLLSFGEFGAPMFLRFSVFPVASFTQLSAFYNFGTATAAAMPMIALVFAGLLARPENSSPKDLFVSVGTSIRNGTNSTGAKYAACAPGGSSAGGDPGRDAPQRRPLAWDINHCTQRSDRTRWG